MAFKAYIVALALASSALAAPVEKRQSATGDLWSPAAYSEFAAGATVSVTLADYPCPQLSEFHVLIVDPATGESRTIQQGLGGNGDCSAVTYGVTLPTDAPFASGNFLLVIDEFVRDVNGHVVDTQAGPQVPISIHSAPTPRDSGFGALTSPAAWSSFGAGDVVTVTLENYPSTMCQFAFKLIDSNGVATTIQQGLGPNTDLTPVTYRTSIPYGLTSGPFSLFIDEFLRNADGQCLDSWTGPAIDITIA